jgi:hypothetical protein
MLIEEMTPFDIALYCASKKYSIAVNVVFDGSKRDAFSSDPNSTNARIRPRTVASSMVSCEDKTRILEATDGEA